MEILALMMLSCQRNYRSQALLKVLNHLQAMLNVFDAFQLHTCAQMLLKSPGYPHMKRTGVLVEILKRNPRGCQDPISGAWLELFSPLRGANRNNR